MLDLAVEHVKAGSVKPDLQWQIAKVFNSTWIIYLFIAFFLPVYNNFPSYQNILGSFVYSSSHNFIFLRKNSAGHCSLPVHLQ
jgi:carboxypeptidase C (cathepsin A)